MWDITLKLCTSLHNSSASRDSPSKPSSAAVLSHQRPHTPHINQATRSPIWTNLQSLLYNLFAVDSSLQSVILQAMVSDVYMSITLLIPSATSSTSLANPTHDSQLSLIYPELGTSTTTNRGSYPIKCQVSKDKVKVWLPTVLPYTAPSSSTAKTSPSSAHDKTNIKNQRNIQVSVNKSLFALSFLERLVEGGHFIASHALLNELETRYAHHISAYCTCSVYTSL